MSTFDDPNREAVGLDPIHTGAGDPGAEPEPKQPEPTPAPEPEPEPEPEPPDDTQPKAKRR